MKFVWGILALALVVAGGITLRPDLLPDAASWVLTTPMTYVISVRTWLILAFLGAALFLFIFAFIRHKLVDAGRIALATGLAFLLIGLGHAGIVYSRGVDSPSKLGPDHGVTVAGQGDGSVTVLTYNTLGGTVDFAALADAVRDNGVDVLVLPETSTAGGEHMVELLAERGYTFQQFDTGTDEYATEFESTVVLLSSAMGEYTQTTPVDMPASTVTITPASGYGPTIVAVHPFAPSPRVLEEWEQDVTEVYAACQMEGAFIIAGDFNSTIDHQLTLGGSCADGGIQAGVGGLGTWPTRLPSILGTPIDRVLHDGHTYEGSDAMLLEIGDSDHRGLIVRLGLIDSDSPAAQTPPAALIP